MNPCVTCGACCAHYRVAFYWSEAEPALHGCVPADLCVALDAHRLAMLGTLSPPLRCAALRGEVGGAVSCEIYPNRPSPCRALEPWRADGQVDAQCSKARVAWGLPPLTAR